MENLSQERRFTDSPSIPVRIGLVQSLPNQTADKGTVAKLLEESAEVYSAWERYKDYADGDFPTKQALADEIRYELADVIQVCANIAAALEREFRCDIGVSQDIPTTVYLDLWVQAVWKKNQERGRC